MPWACLDRLQGHAHVAGVVHGVEDAEDVHAVVGGLAHEFPHHVVRIVAVAKQVLAPQQHVDAGVGQRPPQTAQPLPGVLAQEAHAGIEGGPAPGLQGPETDLVQLGADGQHVLGAHAGGDEGLVAVAQDEFGD